MSQEPLEPNKAIAHVSSSFAFGYNNTLLMKSLTVSQISIMEKHTKEKINYARTLCKLLELPGAVRVNMDSSPSLFSL
jgi:hypothetical protein